MNSTLSNLLIFAAGLGLGSVVTYKIVKDKYDKLINEEIESVKAAFSKKDEWETVEPKKLEEIGQGLLKGFEEGLRSEKDMNLQKYADILAESKYRNYATKKEDIEVDRPYVIEPGEFGEMDGYETISLTYYADEVITDDFGNIVDDVDELIGLESLSHFGEFEDDSVFVRNDAKRCDYEILMVEQRYYDGE